MSDVSIDVVVSPSISTVAVSVPGQVATVEVVAGIPGPAGEPGRTGPAGANGLSAYQVAVANGFVGSEAQWLASLTGPAGEPGQVGATGPAGSDAPRGVYVGSVPPEVSSTPFIWVETLGGGNYRLWFNDGI